MALKITITDPRIIQILEAEAAGVRRVALLKVKGPATAGTVLKAAGFDRPAAREEPHVTAIFVEWFTLVIDLADLFELNQHTVVRAVVAEADRSEDECGIQRIAKFEGTGHRAVLGRATGTRRNLTRRTDPPSRLRALAQAQPPARHR